MRNDLFPDQSSHSPTYLGAQAYTHTRTHSHICKIDAFANVCSIPMRVYTSARSRICTHRQLYTCAYLMLACARAHRHEYTSMHACACTHTQMCARARTRMYKLRLTQHAHTCGTRYTDIHMHLHIREYTHASIQVSQGTRVGHCRA